MLSNILITGFEKFNNLPINPTQFVVEELKASNKIFSQNIYYKVLPVEYENAANIVKDFCKEINFDIVILLGVDTTARGLKIERVAINLDDSKIKDNKGQIKKDKLIVENSPLAYFSNSPIIEIAKLLHSTKIPIILSNHAGTFVCNNTYYHILHYIAENNLSTKCVFVHLPYSDYFNALDSDLSSKQITITDLTNIVQNLIEAFIKIHYEV